MAKPRRKNEPAPPPTVERFRIDVDDLDVLAGMSLADFAGAELHDDDAQRIPVGAALASVGALRARLGCPTKPVVGGNATAAETGLYGVIRGLDLRVAHALGRR